MDNGSSGRWLRPKGCRLGSSRRGATNFVHPSQTDERAAEGDNYFELQDKVAVSS